MMLAHIAGVPVEELAAQLIAAGTGLVLWLGVARRRRAEAPEGARDPARR